MQPTRHRVLVVEDDELMRRAVGRLLSREFDVSFASDGAEALPMVLSGSFDSVLSDVDMPGMRGDELYEAVLAKDPDRAKTIVLMTGGEPRGRAKALLGKVGFLRKPVDPTALRRALYAARKS